MEFKELPGCLGCTQRERTNGTKQNGRRYTLTQIFTRLHGIFSLPPRPEKDNRFSYRCSFQGSLNRKKADKQRHKVRVYLRPVCKATRFRAVYMKNETIQGTLPNDFSANVCRRYNEPGSFEFKWSFQRDFVPFGTINAIHIRACCRSCRHFYYRNIQRVEVSEFLIFIFRRLLFASVLFEVL